MKPSNLFRLKTFLAITASFAAVSSAHAEGTGTHGGDVVACFKNGMASVISKRAAEYKKEGLKKDALQDDGLAAIDRPLELLDLYQIRHTTDIDGNSPPLTQQSFSSNLKSDWNTLKIQIKDTNYWLFNSVISQAEIKIPLESNWRFHDSGVPAVDDSNEKMLLPDNCLLLQVAIQSSEVPQIFVDVDSRLFKRMPKIDQMALLTHEMIYRTAYSDWDDVDSTRTREINGIIYHADFSPDHARTVYNLLEKLYPTHLGTCFRENLCISGNFAMNTIKDGIYRQQAGQDSYSIIRYNPGVPFAGTVLNSFSDIDRVDLSLDHGFDPYHPANGIVNARLSWDNENLIIVDFEASTNRLDTTDFEVTQIGHEGAAEIYLDFTSTKTLNDFENGSPVRYVNHGVEKICQTITGTYVQGAWKITCTE
jgi:hypothetical protein